MPSDRRPLKTRSQRWPHALAKFLLRLGLTPNQISVGGVFIAALGGWLLAFHAHRWWALLIALACVQTRLLCNLLDGLMAVEGGAKAKTGEMFNEIPDRLEDAFLLIGSGYGAGHAWLGWLAALLAVFTAYLRAFSASLGLGQDFCGPGAKPHRMFTLSVGCLLGAAALLWRQAHPILEWALWAVVGLTALTAARRLAHMHRAMNQR